jgi:uncharacterized protein YuzE
MRLKYDLDVGALYIRLSDQKIARTREIDDNTNVDLDAAGDVVGIEVISIVHPWPLSEVLAGYPIPSAEAAQLRAYFGSPAVTVAQQAPTVSMNKNAPVPVAA